VSKHAAPSSFPIPAGQAARLPFLLLVFLLASCEQDKRVVYSSSFLGGVADAQTHSPDVDVRKGSTQNKPTVDTRIVIPNPDGSKTLLARTPKHLMNHIVNTMRSADADAPDLFVNQVLAKETREAYLARGRDPKQAFETLRAHQDDVMALFKTMPMGEKTPGVFLENIGGGVKRMMAEQRIAVDLKWKGIDIVFEKGNFKLVWFVE
jgi:hypothetical protein